MNVQYTLIALLFFICQSVFADTQFITISDIHYGHNNSSKEGQDTGPEFLTVTLERLRSLIKNADFIINLGDLPTHSFRISSTKEEYETLLFHRLYEADSALKPMFYVTGNNDSLTGNYQPFEVDGRSPLTLATDWQGACVYCKGLIIDDTYMRQAGYYSTYVIPQNKDIILIALNSIQFTKLPVFLPSYPHQKEDAALQFSWLEKQLKTSQAKQLLIAMHVPPGTSYLGSSTWHEASLKQFMELLEKYHSRFGEITILFSHSHMDEIRKIQLSDGTAIYAYSTPGVSRNHYNNPGIKSFSLNKQDKLANFVTYYTASTTHWGNDSYQALGTPDSIFPNCNQVILARCLNSMNKEKVCDHIASGLFYGVKNPKVSNQSCLKTFSINGSAASMSSH